MAQDPLQRGSIPPRPGPATPQRPELIDELTVRRDEGGAVAVLREDGREFKIYDFEWELAQRMNGSRTIEDLVRDAQQLGLPANLQTIAQLIRELQSYGLLIEADATEMHAAGRGMPLPTPEVQQAVVTFGAAAYVEDQLGRGDLEKAEQLCLQGLRERPDDAELQSYARVITALRSNEPPVAHNLEPGDFERLLGPAERLLLADRTDVATPLVDLAGYLAVDNSRVTRLTRWLQTGAEPMAPSSGTALARLGPDSGTDATMVVSAPAVVISDWSEQQTRREQTRKRRKIWLAALAVAVALAAIIPYPLKLTEQAELRPATRSEVRAVTAGIVTNLLKHEGDRVEAGDTIAELDTADAKAHLDVLKAQQGELGAQLQKLRAGSLPGEIQRARNVVAGKRVARDFAGRKLSREKKLFANKLASQDEMDAARFDLEIKAKELAHAQSELGLVEAGSRPEDVQAKESEMARLDAELRFAQDELDRKELKSPISGVLTTPHFDETLGRAVQKGELVAEVAQLDRMRAEILVPESELSQVALGQPVLLKVESLPGESFWGTVAFIPVTTTWVELRQESIVRVAAYVDSPKLLLRDRMTGWAEIHCGKRTLLSLLFRNLIRWIRVRFLI